MKIKATEDRQRGKSMPGYRAHLVGGLAAFSGAYLLIKSPTNTDILQVMQLLGWCLLGSLFPDIDTKSMGRLIWYRILGVMAVAGLILDQWAIIGFSGSLFALSLLAKHRGLFHRLWFIFLLALLGLIVTDVVAPQYLFYMQQAILFFVIGAFSHILLDGVVTNLKRMRR